MREKSVKNILKCIALMMALWIAVCGARPADGNYDMIMPGEDNTPAESMQFQNFDTFYNAELSANDMSELQMDESRGNVHIRPPQPLNEAEKRLRARDEDVDVVREKRNQKTLKKGTTQANHDGLAWEQFDYDAYVNHG